MDFFKKVVDWISSLLLPSSVRGRRERIQKRLRRALDCYAGGQYDRANQLFLESIQIAEEFGPESLELADYLSRLGEIHHSTGNYSDAEPLLTRALEIRQTRFGPDAGEICGAINDLALLHYTQGKYEEGEKLYQRLLSVLESRQGTERELITCLDNYAALLRKLRRDEESDRLRARAREIRDKLKRK